MTDDFDAVQGKDMILVAVPADGDAFDFEEDGERWKELTVWNTASVTETHFVNSVNGYESFTPEVAVGDDLAGPTPEAVTERLAALLYDEFGVEAESHGIRAIDVTDDDVRVLYSWTTLT